MSLQTLPGGPTPAISQSQSLSSSDIFTPVALSTSQGLEIACTRLRAAFHDPGHIESALVLTRHLLNVGGCIFPFLLSRDTVLNGSYEATLTSTFPSTAKLYVNSTAHQVLVNLKSFYASIPPGEDESDTFKSHYTLYKNTRALEIISTINFSYEPSQSMGDDEDIPFLVRKHHKKKSRGGPITKDDSVFREIGATVPRGQEDVNQLETRLLKEQKEILKIYLSRLLDPISVRHANNMLRPEPASSSSKNLGNRISSNETVAANPNLGNSHALQPSVAPRTFYTARATQFLEENVKDFGPWTILLSADSLRYLRQTMRTNRSSFEIVKKKIQELSIGFFSKSNQKRLVGHDNEVPIFEAKMTDETRLVYAIDCIHDAAGQGMTQAIKLFGVYTHAQIDKRLWAAVAHWSARRGTEYRKRCMARQADGEGNTVPCSWPPVAESYEPFNIEMISDPEMSLRLHALLTHEKFVALTQSVLDGIIADHESTHPFSVSLRENEIIRHPSSCFVVGRSGTGKTTTMLFKMLGIERTGRILGERKMRQVFVTQSRVLAERVEEYFVSLIESCAGELQTVEETEWRAAKRKNYERDLIDLDEEDDSSSPLPHRFSELEDKHFPLFLTFDKLCRLLEAEMTASGAGFDNTSTSPIRGSFLPNSTGLSKRRILYEDFRAKYWPHFPQNMVKGLDPALVWNEIQGVIHGSELSLQSSRGYLDRNTYEALSQRTQATYAKHRPRLYDICENYVKLKTQRQELDAADRTHILLRYLHGAQELINFDYLYVDEVQDNLLIDIKLLRALCCNPHGIFWAGDAAQQITSTAFRFSDMKSFLYRVEESDDLVQARKRSAVHPQAFTLSVNYRSHGGIIDCARSTIALLTKLWPDSIDALEEEQGLIPGPKPMFFAGWDRNFAHYEQFRLKEGSNQIEFGAQQCILVRNSAARESLRQQIGDAGVILTLYESKGLEFNDVLLYNFFEDSMLTNEWRIVLSGLDDSNGAAVSLPTFNEVRHAGVCSELKFLYVGLTRARNHLWIWDSSESAEPMKQFWELHSLIDIKRPGDYVPRLAVSSTAEEWKEKGHIFFDRKNYQQAITCFKRAKEPLLCEISHGFQLRTDARLLDVGTSQRKAAFLDAAEHFRECAKKAHRQSRKCFVQAGGCYAEAGKDRMASDAFYCGEEFTKAAQYARKAGDFERAVEIVQGHRDLVAEAVAAKIIGVCQVHFLREKEYKKAKALFKSDQDYFEYFDVFGFDKTPILIEIGRFEEAADIYIQNGDAIGAIKLYLQTNSEASRAKAAAALLEEWWRCVPFSTTVDILSSPVVATLNSLSQHLEGVAGVYQEEIGIFQAIANDDIALLTASCRESMKGGNVAPALRGFFHLFQNVQDIKFFGVDQMGAYLDNLHLFGARLRSILAMDQFQFSLAPETQKLLGYRVSSESFSREAVLLPSSAINRRLAQVDIGGSRPIANTSSGETTVLVEDAGRIGRELLAKEFRAIIGAHNNAAHKARMFQPICRLNLSNNCQRPDCNYLHVSTDALKETINYRFRLFLHQIIVANNMDCHLKRERLALRRKWISRLMDVLYPQNSNIGKLADITIYESNYEDGLVRHGLAVLRDWIRDVFYGLDPSYVTHMLELFLIASAIDHYGVPRYFFRAHSAISRRTLSDGRRKLDSGHMQPLTLDLFNICFPRVDTPTDNGVAFLQHMINSGAPMDVHAFVCVLERVTTHLLVAIKPNLHSLVIPLSWLFFLAQRESWPGGNTLGYLPQLLNSLKNLVRHIERGASHLTVEGNSIRVVPGQKRTMLARRILRCVVLHGCNYDNTDTRNLIGTEITGLWNGDTSNPILPMNYMNARTWDDLVWAATQPNTDAIVQLVRKEGGAPIPNLAGIEKFAFPDIPTVLHAFAKSPLPTVCLKKQLDARAKEFVPLKQNSGTGPTGEMTVETTAVTTQDVAPTETTESNIDDQFTESENAAARRIQTAYRNYCRRIGARSRTGALNHWFRECASIEKLSQCPIGYRVLVLGPLPHLLVCANAFRKKLEEEKNSISKKTHTVDHGDLEEAMEQLQRLLDKRREFLQEFNEVKPSSTVHKTKDVSKLRSSVAAICSRVGNFCTDKRYSAHFRLAYKGIVRERVKKVMTAPIKPSLNTSDLFE